MKKVTASILVASLCACAAIAAPVKVKADTLLKTNDVEAVIGKLKGAPKPDTGLMGESICKYENADGQWVNVSVYSSEKWGWKKGETSEMHPTPLAGLGEEAFWVKRGSDVEVYVRKGANLLEVDSSGGIKFAKPIAEKALANLK